MSPRPKPKPRSVEDLHDTIQFFQEERRILASERRAVAKQLREHNAELTHLRERVASDAVHIDRLITERDELAMAQKDGTDLKQLKRDAEDQEKRLCELRNLFECQLAHVLRDMRLHIG